MKEAKTTVLETVQSIGATQYFFTDKDGRTHVQHMTDAARSPSDSNRIF